MNNYKIISEGQLLNNRIGHILFTIMQLCAFGYTFYYIMNSYFDFWERTGYTAKTAPVESTAMIALGIGVIVVSILNLFRPKHLFIYYDREKGAYLSFNTYEDKIKYGAEKYPHYIV